jgi:uncharacterized protein (DUF488 family)
MTSIFTIGYEGTNISDFLETLVDARIGTLVDVRALPLSRKPGFSKGTLSDRLADCGISYQHFRALGDPKEGREAARAGRHSAFRHIYSRHLRTTEAQAALRDLLRLAGASRVCMMCFERDPLVCHRSLVARWLARRKFAPIDLFVGGLSNDARPRGYPRQGATAAQ